MDVESVPCVVNKLALCLMKDPYDDKLTWPLQKKFDITLLNQLSDKECHTVE